MTNDIWKIPSSPLLTVIVFLFVICVTATCNKPIESSPVVIIEQEITPQPVRVGSATLQLRLVDNRQRPLIGADILFEANMSHGGMAPVFSKTVETEPGQYQTTLNLTMAGDWIILAHITLANGQNVQRQLDVKGVLPK